MGRVDCLLVSSLWAMLGRRHHKAVDDSIAPRAGPRRRREKLATVAHKARVANMGLGGGWLVRSSPSQPRGFLGRSCKHRPSRGWRLPGAARACRLERQGVEYSTSDWYSSPLWTSVRSPKGIRLLFYKQQASQPRSLSQESVVISVFFSLSSPLLSGSVFQGSLGVDTL